MVGHFLLRVNDKEARWGTAAYQVCVPAWPRAVRVCATVAARPNARSGCQRWYSQRHELTGAIGLWPGSFSTAPSHLMLRHHFCSEQIHRFPFTCCTHAVLLLLRQTFLPFFLPLYLSFSLSLSHSSVTSRLLLSTHVSGFSAWLS